MNTCLLNEIEALKDMSVGELQDKYQEAFGEPARSRHKDFLAKRIAWRIQANREGGLSERARRRAAELANESDLRVRIPISYLQSQEYDAPAQQQAAPFSSSGRAPMPGTMLTREYQGKNIRVLVLEKGFEYQGKVYRSLSGVAKVVTGTQWNGPLFFGLKKTGGRQ